MKRWVVLVCLLGVVAVAIFRLTGASDGGETNDSPIISPRAVRIDAQLGLRLERDLPDSFTEGDTFDARVVNPAKLMVLGMREVRKGDRVTLKVLPDGHFQIVRQQKQPHLLQFNKRGRVVTTESR